MLEEKSDEDQEEAENNDERELTQQLWTKLSPPVPEESVVQRWYGAIYHGKKKSHLYVGKAIRRFLDDADGPVSGIELDCLKPHIGKGSPNVRPQSSAA